MFIHFVFFPACGEVLSIFTARLFRLSSMGCWSSAVITQIVMVQPVQQRRGGRLSDVPGFLVHLLWERGKRWVGALC